MVTGQKSSTTGLRKSAHINSSGQTMTVAGRGTAAGAMADAGNRCSVSAAHCRNEQQCGCYSTGSLTRNPIAVATAFMVVSCVTMTRSSRPERSADAR